MTGWLASPVRLLLALSAALIVAAVFVSPGFFIIDEVVYFLGLDAFARTGGYLVENGFGTFGMDEFKIWLLQTGTDGIVSQYPAGTAWAGAVLLPLLGQKALIALNVAAGVGTLFATYALAQTLFNSARVALGAVVLLALFTFWSEYVYGHWPHSVSILCTTLALLTFLRAMPRETGAFGPAVLSGLAIGTGMLFRLDGVLLAPGIAVATILWATRPVTVLAGGAVGISPMIALLAFLNHAKFGSWNPLSYGVSGGGTDIASHLDTLAVLAAGLVGLIVLRNLPTPGPRVRGALALAALAGVALLLLTPLAPQLWKLINGSWAILFDVTAVDDPRPGIRRLPDGTLSFWGLPKKALFQSLPWIGILTYLAGARDVPWRAVSIVLIVSAIWALPFVAQSWHGGLGSNMRYFLPILPGLAAVSSFALHDLASRHANGAVLLRNGLLAALVLALLVRLVAPDAVGQIHQIYATWLCLSVLVIALAAGLVRSQLLTKAALVVVGAALGLGLFLSGSDLFASQSRRAFNDMVSAATADLPAPVVFYETPQMFTNVFGEPERFLTLSYPPGGSGRFNPELAEQACARGYRLVMWELVARSTGLPEARLAALDLPALAGPDRLVEVTCD